MFRSLKALPLTLALAALSIFTTSCGSSGQAQIRLINAIPDGQPVDVYVNGTRIVQSFSFGGVYPPPTTPASYVKVTSGSATMQSFLPGDTINPVPPMGTMPLNGSTQYTVVAIGLELNESPPLLITDNNTVPASGNVEFRIINASVNSPAGGVDVYIVPPGTDITNYTAQIRSLSYTQASDYPSGTVAFAANGYAVIVTASGQKKALIPQPSTPKAGSITTLVLVDNAGGNNGMSQTPLVLNDVN
jgi:hypothetical protein